MNCADFLKKSKKKSQKIKHNTRKKSKKGSTITTYNTQIKRQASGKCSPTSKSKNINTCFDKDALLRLANMWNQTNRDKIITHNITNISDPDNTPILTPSIY